MQLLPKTIHILGDRKGELKNYILIIPKPGYLSATLNISAGVRWLFRKREIAASKLGRELSWIEVIAEYKDYPKNKKSLEDSPGMKKFQELYARLKK